MNTNNIKGHKNHLRISKSSFPLTLNLFQNVNIMKIQFFDDIKYDLKGHIRSLKLKSFGTDFV